MADLLKMELEGETCCVCGGGGELMTPEEHDAGAPGQVPLRTMLLHLNSSKVVPDGRLCSNCIRRTMEAYEFTAALNNKAAPPLSEKIRALRRSSPVYDRRRNSGSGAHHRRQVSLEQLECLLRRLRAARGVALGYNKTTVARAAAARLWRHAARALNDLPGARKTPRDWAKYWIDYKSKLKKRIKIAGAAQRGSMEAGAGAEGGFSDIDLKFLALMDLADTVVDEPLEQEPMELENFDDDDDDDARPPPLSSVAPPTETPTTSAPAPEPKFELKLTMGSPPPHASNQTDSNDSEDSDSEDQFRFNKPQSQTKHTRRFRRPVVLTEAEIRSSLVNSIRLKAKTTKDNGRSIERAVSAMEQISDSLKRIEQNGSRSRSRSPSPAGQAWGRRKHCQVTYAQLDLLHTYLRAHRGVALGHNKSAADRAQARRVWLRVARALARLPGAQRSATGWAKYWIDYKSKLKKRIRSARAAQARDPAAPGPEFNTIELKFLSIMHLTDGALGDDPLQLAAAAIPRGSEEPPRSPVPSVMLPTLSVQPSGSGAPHIQLHVSASRTPPDAGILHDDDDESEESDDQPAPRARNGHPSPAHPLLNALRRPRLLSEAETRGALVRSIRLKAEAARVNSQAITRAVAALEGIHHVLQRIETKLHELTQTIDVFIVVGGEGGDVFREQDVLAVDAAALRAAAGDPGLQRARNARGDHVYQCSVCPDSFQRVSEFRSHVAQHPADAAHSCWTCGAQFAARGALAEHAAQHAAGAALACALCAQPARCAAELRRHEAACPPRCPACHELFPDRASLSSHAAAAHGRASGGPYSCGACLALLPTAALLSAHLLRHRQARQFVCGYDHCILRFANRSNLMAHIRKCHAGEVPELSGAGAGAADAAPAAPAPAPAPAGPVPCDSCERTFGSAAAMKRHARVHRPRSPRAPRREADGDWTDDRVEYLDMD